MANDQQYCICGRAADKLHCPKCGCATVYGLASKRDYITRQDGIVAELRVYRCRKCTAVFNDNDWQLGCTAPPAQYGRPQASPQMRGSRGAADNVADKLTSLVENPTVLEETLAKFRKKYTGG